MSDEAFKQDTLQRMSVIETSMSMIMAERPTIQQELRQLQQDVERAKDTAAAANQRVDEINKQLGMLTTAAVTFITFIIGAILALK